MTSSAPKQPTKGELSEALEQLWSWTDRDEAEVTDTVRDIAWANHHYLRWREDQRAARRRR